jgi:hypothetical protein
MGRQHRGVRLVGGILFATVLGLGVAATPAIAAPLRGLGFETPAQPYKGNPDKTDWVGSYLVNGNQVWCVQFAFLAPDSDEQYQPGEPLKTKWGTELAPDVAADISYLLLRHAETKSADVAAALGHLLHSWTAAPQTPDQLSPTLDFRHIAYDVDFHLANLPPGARAMVATLRDEAAANRGPWTATVTAPTAPQIIGTPGDWTMAVLNAAGKNVPSAALTVTVTGGVLADGTTTAKLATPDTGKPLAVKVSPTEPNVSVSVSVDSPADRPVVQQAIQVDTQRIVTTGGKKQITVNKNTTAVNAPGTVKVTKTNEQTGKGIAGVSLRLTAADKIAPAVGQDGKALIGPDERPTVVVSGADGTVTIANVKAPQDICVIEVAVPAGFEQNFDPAAPPSACGAVKPGGTLALTVANKANTPTVPVAIPAGDAPIGLVHGTVSSVPDPAALVLSLAGLLVIVAGLGGLFVRRRIIGRR